MTKEIFQVSFDEESKDYVASYNDASVIDSLNIISLIVNNIRENTEGSDKEQFANALIELAAQGKRLVLEDDELIIL